MRRVGWVLSSAITTEVVAPADIAITASHFALLEDGDDAHVAPRESKNRDFRNDSEAWQFETGHADLLS